jgi:hypothetical protein
MRSHEHSEDFLPAGEVSGSITALHIAERSAEIEELRSGRCTTVYMDCEMFRALGNALLLHFFQKKNPVFRLSLDGRVVTGFTREE